MSVIITTCRDCWTTHKQKVELGITVQQFLDELIRICPECKGILEIVDAAVM